MPSSAGHMLGSPRFSAAAGLLALLCSSCTMAVHSSVLDQSGNPVKDAVVYATAEERRMSLTRGNPKAAMTVENLEFRPPVLPVRAGTGVSFLNRDDLAHQIYSISKAKNFELFVNRLSTSGEVVFDRPGAVVLGCATHDQMVGHVYVTETPYFATTGSDGRAVLPGLPRGAYDVRVWHPDLQPSAGPPATRVTDAPSHRVGVDFRITVHSRASADGLPPRPAPTAR